MRVYRIGRAIYAHDLSGKGAELVGGRWNSKGFPMVYTSESRALCTLEVAVHLPLGIIPKDYQLSIIEIPDEIKILDIKKNQLSSDWKSIPHSHSTQVIGNQFLEQQKYAVLKVPSAIIEDEFNYLINPRHLDSQKIKFIKAEDFSFDKRLLE